MRGMGIKKKRWLPDYRFTFFSALEALFWAMVAPASYMVVFMNDQSFTNSQIGIALAFNNLSCLVSLPIWGMVADKLGKRKTLIILYFGLAISSVFTAIFTGSVPLTIALIFLVLVFRGSVASITDSWVIAEVNTPDMYGNRIHYGPIRSLGSIGYALAGFLFYFMFTTLHVDTRWSWLASTFFAIPCIFLAMSYREQGAVSAAPRKPRKISMRLLQPGRLAKNYYFATFFVNYMLFNIPGYFGLSYIPQLLSSMGTAPVFVGVLGSIRALCEVPLLFCSKKIIQKMGYKGTLFVIGTALAVEQASYIFSQQMWQIILFQMLHGCINGLLLGAAVGYIFSLVPPELSATAQTFCGASCSAVTILGNLISGALIDHFGVRAIFIVSASSAVLAIALFAGSLLLGRALHIAPYDAGKDPVSQRILAQLYAEEESAQ